MDHSSNVGGLSETLASYALVRVLDSIHFSIENRHGGPNGNLSHPAGTSRELPATTHVLNLGRNVATGSVEEGSARTEPERRKVNYQQSREDALAHDASAANR